MSEGVRIASRALRGSAALSLVAVVNAVGQLATLPIAMKFWGPAHYGEWVLLSGAITFLTLADLGLQTHVVNLLSAHHAQQDQPAFLQTLHSAVRLQLLIVSATFVTICGVVFFLPVDRWLEVRTATPFDVRLALVFLGLEVLLSVPMGIIAGSYRATGFLVRAALLSVVQRFAFYLFPLLAMVGSGSFAVLAAVRVVLNVVISGFLLWDLSRLHSWWRLTPLRGTLQEGLRMLGPGLLFVLLVLADYLSQQSAIFILQRVSGPDTVSQFVTHRTAVNVARLASGMLTAAMWVEFTVLEARAEHATLQQAHRSLLRVNAWLVGGVTLLLVPVAQFLYGTWTLRKLQLDWPTLALLALQTVLWGAWSASATVLRATNRQGQMAGILLVASIVSAALSAVLAPLMGMRGCALASVLADVLLTAWLTPVLAGTAVGDHVLALLRNVGPFLVLGVAVPFLAAYSVWRCVPNPNVGAILGVSVGLLSSAVLGWRNLQDYERAYLNRLVVALRRKLAQNPSTG